MTKKLLIAIVLHFVAAVDEREMFKIGLET